IMKKLFYNFMISTLIHIILRIMDKSIYISIKILNEEKKKNIFIYSSDHHSLLIKLALDSDETSNIHVVGFIDEDSQRSDKYIEQKKVYSFYALNEIRDKYEIKKVLLSESSLNEANTANLMQICGDAGIHLIKVPSSDKWLYGKLDSHQMKDLNIDDLLGRKPIQLDKKNILKELKGKRV